MSTKISMSRKMGLLLAASSLLILSFQMLSINMPDDIDVSAGIQSASATASDFMNTVTAPRIAAQLVKQSIGELPKTPPIPATAAPLPPIDLVSIKIKETERLARQEYRRKIPATPVQARYTPSLNTAVSSQKVLQTTCYDAARGYFACTVIQ